MKNITTQSQSSDPLLTQGQIWALTDSNLQIGMVGKTLVHYKHFKGQAKRANNSLTSIRVLKKYLEDNKAVLQAK
jgi:hypothetical protein